MKKKEYKARKGAGFNNEEAQVIGEEIERLKNGNGFITSQAVVISARSKKSLLHDYFEWTDSKAAEQYRIQQARNLINHVVEVMVTYNGEKSEVRSFHSVSIQDRGKVYVNLQTAITNKDFRKQLLDKALATLQNLTTIIKMLRDLS